MWTVGEFAGDKQNAKMNEDEVMTVMFWNAAARHNRYSTTDGGVGGAAAAAAAAMFMNGKWLMMSVSFRFVCVCVCACSSARFIHIFHYLRLNT